MFNKGLSNAGGQLLHCAPRWEDCRATSLRLSPLREGPCGWTRDAPIALGEALYIALTEGRPFPEAPIQARAAAAFAKREYRFLRPYPKGGIERKMSYQGKKNIPKITVSEGVLYASLAAGNFDASCCQISAAMLRATDLLLPAQLWDTLFSLWKMRTMKRLGWLPWRRSDREMRRFLKGVLRVLC